MKSEYFEEFIDLLDQQKLVFFITQLEESSSFLYKRTPYYARLSLILTDNALEFFLHSLIITKLSVDDFDISLYGEYYPLLLEERDIFQNGRFFDFNDLLKMSTDFKIFPANEDIIVRKMHKIRNEAYHVFKMHEDIIEIQAQMYLKWVINTFNEVFVFYGYQDQIKNIEQCIDYTSDDFFLSYKDHYLNRLKNLENNIQECIRLGGSKVIHDKNIIQRFSEIQTAIEGWKKSKNLIGILNKSNQFDKIMENIEPFAYISSNILDFLIENEIDRIRGN